MSNNSILAYSRDIRGFIAFLKEKGVERFEDVSNTEIVSFLLKLKNEGKSAATVNRKLASLRAFFNYMIVLHRIDHDPTANIKSPRIERKNIEFLTIDEVETWLNPMNQLKEFGISPLELLMHQA